MRCWPGSADRGRHPGSHRAPDGDSARPGSLPFGPMTVEPTTEPSDEPTPDGPTSDFAARIAAG